MLEAERRLQQRAMRNVSIMQWNGLSKATSVKTDIQQQKQSWLLTEKKPSLACVAPQPARLGSSDVIRHFHGHAKRHPKPNVWTTKFFLHGNPKQNLIDMQSKRPSLSSVQGFLLNVSKESGHLWVHDHHLALARLFEQGPSRMATTVFSADILR